MRCEECGRHASPKLGIHFTWLGEFCDDCWRDVQAEMAHDPDAGKLTEDEQYEQWCDQQARYLETFR